jgi:hypothetical protein
VAPPPPECRFFETIFHHETLFASEWLFASKNPPAIPEILRRKEAKENNPTNFPMIIRFERCSSLPQSGRESFCEMSDASERAGQRLD